MTRHDSQRGERRTPTLTDAQRRLLQQFLPAQYEDASHGVLDPAVMTDRAIARVVRNGRTAQARDAIDVVLKTADEPHWPRYVLDAPYDFIEAPESHDALRWLTSVRTRLSEIAADPSIVTPLATPYETGFEPPRVGWWLAADPTLHIVDALRPELDAWMHEPTDATSFRRHFLVDVGSPVGVVAPVTGHGPTSRVERGLAVPTASVAVGVERVVAPTRSGRDQYDLHTWALVFSRPELPLDTAVRQRFPDLCHLFGGYYGQPFDDDHGWPAAMTAQVMERTSGDARARMRSQLVELLDIESDNELTTTVGHLGSMCLPSFTRHWIDRLHWKIDALDWGSPVLSSDESPPLRNEIDSEVGRDRSRTEPPHRPSDDRERSGHGDVRGRRHGHDRRRHRGSGEHR